MRRNIMLDSEHRSSYTIKVYIYVLIVGLNKVTGMISQYITPYFRTRKTRNEDPSSVKTEPSKSDSSIETH